MYNFPPLNFEKRRKKSFTRPLILHKLLCNGSALIRYRKPTDRVKLSNFPTYLIVDKLHLKRRMSENFECSSRHEIFVLLYKASKLALIFHQYLGKVHSFTKIDKKYPFSLKET